ncbi:MAG: hypothetical protein QOF61_1088, partial [Acidobacteriota bacterium]|nr:hypothetical protein [Acidobacteriota bacterium]
MKATKLSTLSLLATMLVISVAISCAPRSRGASVSHSGVTPKKTLRPFGSEQELAGYFRDLAERQKREWAKRREVAAGA